MIPDAVHGVGVEQAPSNGCISPISHHHCISCDGCWPAHHTIHSSPIHQRVAPFAEQPSLAGLQHHSWKLCTHRHHVLSMHEPIPATFQETVPALTHTQCLQVEGTVESCWIPNAYHSQMSMVHPNLERVHYPNCWSRSNLLKQPSLLEQVQPAGPIWSRSITPIAGVSPLPQIWSRSIFPIVHMSNQTLTSLSKSWSTDWSAVTVWGVLLMHAAALDHILMLTILSHCRPSLH